MKRRAFLIGGGATMIKPTLGQSSSGFSAQSGDRFSRDDISYALTDIIAPSYYTLSGGPAPYAEEAHAALTELLNEGAFRIDDPVSKTRWGEHIVRAWQDASGKSLQQLLIEHGAARVAPQTDDHEWINQLLQAEAEARNARLGLWALSAYRVWPAASAAPAIGGYHLVEGVVARAAATKSRFYLNFGANYREDFTAGAKSSVVRKWRKAGFDPELLEGKKVRIRGFVQSINGPSVDLVHQKQIEELSLLAAGVSAGVSE